MLKKWEIALLFGIVTTIIISCTGFGVECAGIRQKVLRLHILANSDSRSDQQLKLAVRDRLLENAGEIFCGCTDIDAAVESVQDNIEFLEAAAQKVIDEHGFDYEVDISVKDISFETRVYDRTTMPAGVYTAVQVRIGDAKGKNWWCVMYPNLCIPCASDTSQIGDVLDVNETDIVQNSGKYLIKFKALEIFESIKALF